jgi:hypothetical protein
VCVLQNILKFTSQILVYQAAVFCVGNAPKVTYEHLRFEKFCRGLYPRTPVKKGREDIRRERRGLEGRGGEGRGEERRGGEGPETGREGRKGRRGGKRVVPPRLKLVPPRFPWAGYGPVRETSRIIYRFIYQRKHFYNAFFKIYMI